MKKLLALALTTCLLAACGAKSFATQLRVVLAAGAPILTVFVQQGKISESFRLKLVTDLNEEANYVGVLGDCFDAAADSKPAKLQCVQTFQRSTRPVLERNFKTNQTVRFIGDDIDAIISSAIIFYGGTLTAVRSTSAKPTTEKEIKARVEKLKRDLGQ